MAGRVGALVVVVMVAALGCGGSARVSDAGARDAGVPDSSRCLSRDDCGGDWCLDGICANTCEGAPGWTSCFAYGYSHCCSPSEHCCYVFMDDSECFPADASCPLECPGGYSTCPVGSRCVLTKYDAGLGLNYCGEWPAAAGGGCTTQCPAQSVCGQIECCGEGTRCADGGWCCELDPRDSGVSDGNPADAAVD